MSHEIRLSIEETNELRAKIGLPLIPVPEAGRGSIRKDPPSKGLSVHQTNQLRHSLGLNRLDSTEEAPSIDELNDVKARSSLFEVSEPDEWEKRMELASQRKLTEPGGVSSARGDSCVTSDSALSEGNSSNTVPESLKLSHTKKHLNNLSDGEVLTLNDTNILQEEDTLGNEKLLKDIRMEKNPRQAKRKTLSFEDDQDEDLKSDLAILEGSTIFLEQDPSPEKSSGDSVFQSLFDDLNDVLEKAKPVTSFKKKGKKASKSRKRSSDFDEIETQQMTSTKLEVEEEDDDLEKLLNENRKKRIKSRILTAEEIANEVKLHQRVDAISHIDGGFVYDETVDFFDHLSEKLKSKPSKGVVTGLNLQTQPPEAPSEEQSKEQSQEQSIKQLNEPLNQQKEGIFKELISSESDIFGEQALSLTTNNLGHSSDKVNGHSSSHEPIELDIENGKVEEKFGTLLSTLKYLREQKATTSQDDLKSYRTKRAKEKEEELKRIKISIESRKVKEELAEDRDFQKLEKLERDTIFDRILTERLETKGIIEVKRKQSKYQAYSEPQQYNPKVSITYKDDQGNVLDKKQAWKQLSHRYHGLGLKKPGKRKSETVDRHEKIL